MLPLSVLTIPVRATPRTLHDHFHHGTPHIVLMRISRRRVWVAGGTHLLGNRLLQHFTARQLGETWVIRTRMPLRRIEPVIKHIME